MCTSAPPTDPSHLQHYVAQDVEHTVVPGMDDQLTPRQLAQVEYIVDEHAAAEERALQHRQVDAGVVIGRQAPVVLQAPQRTVQAVQRIAKLSAQAGVESRG